MGKVSDNLNPKLILVEGSTPSSPSSGQQKIFIDSVDHKLKRVNSSGVVTTIEGGGSGGGFSSYSSYTPALTATTTNPTLGSGSSAVGDYAQDNKVVVGNFEITFGSSGVAAGSGTYLVSLPVNADTTFSVRHIGSAQVYHNATGQIINVMIHLNATGTAKIYYPGAPGGLMTNSVPFTWSTGDLIFGSFTYRAA